jgi:hypothetical protein
MEKTKLFCTFTKKNDIYKTLQKIDKKYKLFANNIYALENLDNDNEMILTYNVYNYDEMIPNTIFVHRKKETNTLYSLNAMNEIIKKINNGKLDENIEVPWKNYKNSLIILRGYEKKLVILNTKLFGIIKLN